MKSIANKNRNHFREMNKMKKSTTGPISPRIVQKKQFNVVKPKSQDEKPWKANNSSFRNSVSNAKGESKLMRADLSKLVRVNKFQASSENGRPAPDSTKVSVRMQFEGANGKTASEKMLNQIETLTARSVVNQIDAKRIHDLMQQLKEQLTTTAAIHKNRTEDVRNQQESTLNGLLSEKNARIVKLELQVDELSDKLKERHDELKSESLMLKKELHQLKEILKVKSCQVDRLKDELIDAQNKIETLEIQKERAIDAASPMEIVQEEEVNEHLDIISKALRSNQKLMKIIEIETIA